MATRSTSGAAAPDETMFVVNGVANRDLVTGQSTRAS
jgi:hypothetical protein